MVLRFPKTAEQIDKLADHELASLIIKGRHFGKIIDGLLENMKEFLKKKIELETKKHKLESTLEMLELKEKEGKLTAKERVYFEEVEKSVLPNVDILLEETESKGMAHLKHMQEILNLFRLNIDKLMAVFKKEITFTDRERKVLKQALKASLPFKQHKS